MKNFIKKTKNAINFLYHSTINSIFPNFCWNCNEILKNNFIGYCHQCFNEIPLLFNIKHCYICYSTYFLDNKNICQHCRDKKFVPKYFDRNYSCFQYEDELRELISAGKFQKRKTVWAFLANSIIKLIEEEKLDIYNSIIIPVPISKNRLKHRGFNQSYILTKTICDFYNIPLNNEVIIKTKNNIEQSKLSLKERQNNPIGCYKLKNNKIIKNKTIFLIDDVFTTGSTINECAKILLENNAKNVHSITIARSDLN